MEENYFESEYARIWIENGIVFGEYKPGIQINLDIAQHVVQNRLKVSGEVTRPLLLDVRRIKSIDKQARAFLANNPESLKYVSASAMLIDNELMRLISNFFITIEHPPIPAQIFTSREKALQWLEQYR